MTTQSSVERFLAQESLGLVGVSRSGKKFGNAVLKTLASQGYRLEVVHPEADEIGGLPCRRSVGELAGKVGGLVVVVPPAETEKVVREAAAAGIAHLWLQQGAASAEAVRYCREQGLDVVHGECILMYARPTGIHKVHRWLWGVLGKLPRDDT